LPIHFRDNDNENFKGLFQDSHMKASLRASRDGLKLARGLLWKGRA